MPGSADACAEGVVMMAPPAWGYPAAAVSSVSSMSSMSDGFRSLSVADIYTESASGSVSEGGNGINNGTNNSYSIE